MHRCVDEQRVPGPTLERAVVLDFFHDGRVVANTGVEAEVATVHFAEADGFDVVAVDAVGKLLHSKHRIVGHTQRSGKHVGASARQRTERSVGAGNAGGHFIERAIAAKADDDVDATSGGILRKSGGVAAAVRFDDLNVVAARQNLVHYDGVSGRHGRRERVDNEQDPQDPEGISDDRLGAPVRNSARGSVTIGTL